VKTDSVTAITQTTAKCGGKITYDGGAPVTTRGVCWNTSQSPTITNDTTLNGNGIGSFTSSITGLIPDSVYFVRAFAINSAGTAYGNERIFVTLAATGIPTLTTVQVTNITQTTATSGGTITSNGSSPVTARGVCWSISANPTTANSKTSDGIGGGTFVSNLTGLGAGTTYYLRAYATNNTGTAYGNEVIFTTLTNITVPSVTTTALSNITQITATSGGDVTSDGGGPVTARGICWNTSPNPTTTDSHTTDGSGTGLFTSYLTGLTSNTLYYVSAYATDSAGTAYGNQQSFTTLVLSCPGIPTITYGGQVYNTVQIGTQCWMKENLNIGTRIDGSQDQTNNGIIEKYCYNDNVSNCIVYGGLYQWDEMMQYTTAPGVQGICPPVWHLPTDAEWAILTTYLGGVNVAGGKLKETGTIHWQSPNTGATNESGFTALPGGYRDFVGVFLSIGGIGGWWSSTNHALGSVNLEVFYGDDNANPSEYRPKGGFSVPCVKD